MSFASRYIERNINYPAFIQEEPSQKLGLIVVIPACNEPELLKTINSLAACTPSSQDVEVIVVLNQSEISLPEVGLQNKLTDHELKKWKRQNTKAFFKLFVLMPPAFRKKHAGAGLARKTGMDEAVRRFAATGNEEGVIISLDADTLVDTSYFVEIEKHFLFNNRGEGASIRFKHRIAELGNERHREGMQLYETYLHYYKNALAFTGFPNAIYTIGSAFAVRAFAYVKQGGMNKRQAGEDFYFLHKLAQLGEIGEINTTCVHPSARISDRVPFGTGPVLQKWMQGNENLKLTYCLQSFIDLKKLFDLLPTIHETHVAEVETLLEQLSAPLVLFLKDDEFEKALLEIRSNVSGLESFKKRFFLYFNAFKVLKFLNFSHPEFYSFQDLVEANSQLQRT